jgi:hypothetical protein
VPWQRVEGGEDGEEKSTRVDYNESGEDSMVNRIN